MYTPITYKVTFLEDDGSLAGELQGTKGQSIFVPAAKPKKDYEFTHWQEEGGTQTIQKGTNYYTVTKTITFKATYTPNIYTIKFLRDDDTVEKEINATVGSSITVPTAPTKPNYTFTSWIEVGGTERIPSTSSTYTVTRAVTFKAEYNPIIYTVTFFDEDGTTKLGTETGAYGTVINVPTPTPNLGYAFSQWKEVGGTETISNATSYYTITRTATFKAEYIEAYIEIRTQAELNNIRNDMTKKYRLMNDIALNDSGAGYDSSGWLPIGTNSSPFKGAFDGNGHKITGLWIDRGSTNYIGLFGYANGATIKNLGVEIGSRGVKGESWVGGIVGIIYISSITNSYSTGSVSGSSNYVGGIAGYMNAGSSITNSYSTGSVSGSSSYVGGIAGQINSGSITNNAAINPSVSGVSRVNRIVGNILNSNTVSNNFALNRMTVTGNTGGNAGTSKSLAALTSDPTYTDPINGDGNGGLGWKFGNDDANPWKRTPYVNDNYPYLYWENR
jgi:hypothetical protein